MAAVVSEAPSVTSGLGSRPMPTPLRLTLGDVAIAVDGRLTGVSDRVVKGVSIDSRTLVAGDLFIAIRGDRFDGHQFVPDAIRAGAVGVIVARVPDGFDPDAAVIVVADTVRALQLLARHVRRQAVSCVVAITGSVGKTTTKEATAAVLSGRFTVLKSPGNLNNQIGLPLSLMLLRHQPDVAVVELGMNHPGEIRALVGIAEPDVRVWTNVTEAHTGFFSSVDAIADAKAEILEGATDATRLVANADDARVMARAAGFPGSVTTFGLEREADVSARDVRTLGLDGVASVVRSGGEQAPLRTRLLGRAGLLNILAALAVALQFRIPLTEAVDRAATLAPLPRRGEVIRLARDIAVIDDSYNASPTAVQQMLALVGNDVRASRKVAVLGEMLELGERADELHEACGRSAAHADLARLITVGGHAAEALGRAAVAAGVAPGVVSHVSSCDAAADLVASVVRPGDVVLVKGSRGVRMERVVDRLKAELA